MRKKRFYVATDCEGLACVVGAPRTHLSDSPNYATAARQAAREADAAARALFDQDAEEVIIWDNHYTGINMDYELLDPRCKIALGCGHKTRFPEIDESFGGVLFLGYHSREGTPNATQAHTYCTQAYQYYKINGKPVGELEIDAAYAGQIGVPVIFVSSDNVCVGQAKESFPWVETVEVKSLSWTSAISLHPDAACDAIYAGVVAACQRLDEMKPYTIPTPFELEIRFKRMDIANSEPLYDRDRRPFAFLDAFTRVGTLDRLEDLFN